MIRAGILCSLFVATITHAQPVTPAEQIVAGQPFVHVRLGVYTLTEPLRIPSAVTVLCEPGTVFEAAEGAFTGIHDSLVIMENSTNVTILNCEFKGRKETYTEENGYPVSEFRHAIELAGVTNVRLTDVGATNSGGDGVFVGPFVSGLFTEDRKPSRNVTIERLTSRGNLRTGLAVISAEGLTVRDSTFELTKGTATEAGANCEPSHGGDVLKDILFERCTARGNAGSAFRVNMDRQTKFSKPISVTFRDCVGEEVHNGHSLIMVNEFEPPMNPVKPLGFIRWDGSTWSNPWVVP